MAKVIEELVHLHIKISKENSEKLRTLQYFSGQSKGSIVRRAIELLNAEDLKKEGGVK